MNRKTVGDEVAWLNEGVEVRFTPVVPVVFHDPLVNLALRVVVFFSAQLLEDNLIVLAQRIGFEQTPFLGVVIRSESYTCARQLRVESQNPFCHIVHRVGHGQIALQVPDMIDERVLAHAPVTIEEGFFLRQFALGIFLEFYSQQVAGVIVLETRDKHQNHSSRNDEDQVGLHPAVVHLFEKLL